MPFFISKKRLEEIKKKARSDGEYTGGKLEELEFRELLKKLRDLFPAIDDYLDTGGYFRADSLEEAHQALETYRQTQYGKKLAKQINQEGAN